MCEDGFPASWVRTGATASRISTRLSCEIGFWSKYSRTNSSTSSSTTSARVLTVHCGQTGVVEQRANGHFPKKGEKPLARQAPSINTDQGPVRLKIRLIHGQRCINDQDGVPDDSPAHTNRLIAFLPPSAPVQELRRRCHRAQVASNHAFPCQPHLSRMAAARTPAIIASLLANPPSPAAAAADGVMNRWWQRVSHHPIPKRHPA